MEKLLNKNEGFVFQFNEWGLRTPLEELQEEYKIEYNDILKKCPKTGDGVHRWITIITIKAFCAGIKIQEARKEIADAMRGCGRDPQYDEIEAAYRGAVRLITGGVSTKASDKTPKWHPHDIDKAENLINEFEKEALKIGKSLYNDPTQFTGDSGASKRLMEDLFKGYGGATAVLRTLFPEGDPLLCCGRAMNNFITQPLTNYKNLSGYQLIVPNPMTKRKGVKECYSNTPEEKLPDEAYSYHTKDNTGERHYLVI